MKGWVGIGGSGRISENGKEYNWMAGMEDDE